MKEQPGWRSSGVPLRSRRRCPAPNEDRVSWAKALGQLGAFDEALAVARRVDQKGIQQPGQIDAIWAFWRISLNQAKAGKFEAARATLREATRVETPPKADAQGRARPTGLRFRQGERLR